MRESQRNFFESIPVQNKGTRYKYDFAQKRDLHERTKEVKRRVHRSERITLLRQIIPCALSFSERFPMPALIGPLRALQEILCTGIFNNVGARQC